MSSKLRPLVSGIMKNAIITFAIQKAEYIMKAPPIPNAAIIVGHILTDIKREMLSNTPRSPDPKLLMSAGKISPEMENLRSEGG